MRPEAERAAWITSTRLSAGHQGAPAKRQKPGVEIIMIGHRGHPEVKAPWGRFPDGTITLVETVEDVAGAPSH